MLQKFPKHILDKNSFGSSSRRKKKFGLNLETSLHSFTLHIAIYDGNYKGRKTNPVCTWKVRTLLEFPGVKRSKRFSKNNAVFFWNNGMWCTNNRFWKVLSWSKACGLRNTFGHRTKSRFKGFQCTWKKLLLRPVLRTKKTRTLVLKLFAAVDFPEVLL